MSKIQHMNVHDGALKIIDALNKGGCVVIDNLISEVEVTRIQQDLKKSFAIRPDCQGDFYGYHTKRLGALFSKSKMFQKMAIIPLILDIMDEFLLPNCSDYQINLTQAISIGSNENKQILHQDDPMFPFAHPNTEVMLNCMWAIDDFTEDNGATVLVPKSHLWTRNKALNLDFENLPEDMIAKGVMKKGSVLIYLGSLVHCGGQNQTSKPRCGAVISYCLGWLRQAENNYLAYNKGELKDMPQELKKLLGYFVHEPNLGSVDGMHPCDYIDNEVKNKNFVEFIPEAVKPLLKEYRESLGKVG